MAIINLEDIPNGTQSTHTQLNSNFTAIKTQVDDNLDGENFAASAQLTVNSLILSSKIICDKISVTELMTIKLPSNDGSHTLKFKDSLGNTVMTISSDGEVTI